MKGVFALNLPQSARKLRASTGRVAGRRVPAPAWFFHARCKAILAMETTPLNVYILGEHALVINGLKHKLQQKFGSAVNPTLFCDVHQCLRQVNFDTHVLVVDATLEGKCAEVWGRQFRAISPSIEVIVHESSSAVIDGLRGILRNRLVPEAASLFAFV